VTAAESASPVSRPEVEVALLVLERMGLSPADLLAVPTARAVVPTFAEYVPVVSAAAAAGMRKAYGSYWNRVIEQWGERRLDEPTPSEIRLLMAHVRANVVARRNGRGGRSAAEHLVAARRCLYRHTQDDGYITEAANPAQGRQAAAIAVHPPRRPGRTAGRDQSSRGRPPAMIPSWTP
jgi:hypothetical protein